MIMEKESLIENNNYRQGELGQIAERAIQDKNIDEKHWRKIFLTHLFVNRMLRNKIDKEMQKFSIVEQAFLEIKTATVLQLSYRASVMRRAWSTSTSTRRPSTGTTSARSPTTKRPSTTSKLRLRSSSRSQSSWRWREKCYSQSKSSPRTCTVTVT